MRSFQVPRIAFLVLSAAGLIAASQAPPTTPSLSGSELTRLERELALVQHVRRHLHDPQDGSSLAADCRDLRRLHAMAPRPATPSASSLYDAGPMPGGASTGGAAPAADLEILAEIWDARVNDRTPFRLQGRDRLQALDRAQQSLSRLATTVDVSGRDRFMPAMQEELLMLRRDVQMGGDLSDGAIEAALRLSDARAAGRPVPPGPGFGGPPRPSSGSRAAPPLPPGYGMASPSPSSVTACEVERSRAGESESAVSMLDVVDCWSRERASPAWSSQAIEALDWAVQYASIARDCVELETVMTRLRSFGRPPTPYPQDGRRLAELPIESEARLVWLKASGNCR